MTVLGTDARLQGPQPGVELHPPEALDELLPRADFVVVTTPDTPKTRGMFHAGRFARMKPSASLINVGRGACVVLEELVAALRAGRIAGAALDVFETEPLPRDHALWTMPGVIITPHVASHDAPFVAERRTSVIVENCKRFAGRQPLINVVDKREMF
jgi:phosphoglycerate dehydrogenase-like enzyme